MVGGMNNHNPPPHAREDTASSPAWAHPTTDGVAERDCPRDKRQLLAAPKARSHAWNVSLVIGSGLVLAYSLGAFPGLIGPVLGLLGAVLFVANGERARRQLWRQ